MTAKELKAKIVERGHCGTCRYFQVTGREGFYNVGKCTHPAPALGGAMVAYNDIAEFLSCYQHKKGKRTKSAKQVSK